MHAGEGGKDSCLFKDDLVTAYLRYALRMGLETEILYISESSTSIKVTGKNALKLFEKEAGKHCVQRIPPTESRGRRHTSFVSVAVMEITPERNEKLNEKDIEITRQRGHGPGGQHQNTTDSAVRAVHKPTGIMVFINGKHQHENKDIAIEVLTARVAERRRRELHEKRTAQKKDQLGDGSRSGKIRTYNYLAGRATDHRTGKSTEVKQALKGYFENL